MKTKEIPSDKFKVLSYIQGSRLPLLSFFLAVLSLPLCAGASAEVVARDAHTEVELISFAQTVSPGMELWTAVRFKPESNWHLYWKNPGDSGLGPEIHWELPAGAEAGKIRWPYPQLIEQPPLASYGYTNEVLLSVPISIPTFVAAGEVLELKARVTWLACEVECVPGKADLSISLPVTAISQPNDRWMRSFARIRAQWPTSSNAWRVRAKIVGSRLILRVTPLKAALNVYNMAFFPENSALIRHAEPQNFKKIAKGYLLDVPLSGNYSKNLERLEGVLISSEGWRGPDSEKALMVSVELEREDLASRPGASYLEMSIVNALFFAFIGGLILNLMPCVLPVLSLKILGFVKEASKNSRAVLAHGLVFAAGVLVSFWILAGLLLILQTAGKQIGWGFQLQSPAFLITLSFVFFIFALNLFGMFEVGLSLAGVGQGWMRRGGYAGSFISGFFATVVATPCTAPFMGAALGYTLAQPAWISFAVFTAIGLGMAAPYVILCAHPAFLRWVPKPGAWMERLKQFLGFPLLATVAWLAWVLGVQKGSQAVLGLCTGLSLVGIGLWIGSKTREGPVTRFFSTLLVLIGLILPFPIIARSEVSASVSLAAHGLAWEGYSEARLEELREQNKAVFIDFTAAWCLTCQVNERAALNRAEVVAEFQKRGIATLKADWTLQDESIAAALLRYGRNSIPLYVYYPAGESVPKILPEILTPSIILKSLDEE